MFVKICGLSTPESVRTAVQAGADAIGFVLSRSPRQVSPAEARALRREMPPAVLAVGVFAGVPIRAVRAMAWEAEVDVIQLHGTYPRHDFADHDRRLIRATTADAPELRTGAYGEDILLIDAPVPGSGDPWDYPVLAQHGLAGDWVLAGGLTPDTVAGAIRAVSPWGVDVSSGVESARGVKDSELIARFVEAAKSVERPPLSTGRSS
jgi:phosphoribosylanthranilate isomerase